MVELRYDLGAKVPNSFSRRMKLLCNTFIEHDKLKEVLVGLKCGVGEPVLSIHHKRNRLTFIML